jgi:N-hydroxyarylamine O-acetyltransferase
MPTEFLAAYLSRIGESGPVAPDLATLRRLQRAHVAAIPFENLDILLGRGVHLDFERLTDKLIAQRRGGYCFEQNTLFQAALSEVEFSPRPMEARVRAGAGVLLPRTHMVLTVDVAGASWLVDVGFGGEGPHEPVPLTGRESSRAAGLTYRVVREGELFVLQMRADADWQDQYAFLPQPVYPIDFKVANWYTSTHPSSPFVRTLTAQRTAPDVRHILRYPSYTHISDAGSHTETISRDALLPLLRRSFLIDLPDHTVFPAIDNPADVRL